VLFELDPLVVTAPRLKISDPIDPRINFQLQKMLQEKENLRISEETARQSSAYQDLNQLVTPNGIALKTRYTVLGYLLTEGLAGTRDFQLTDQLQRLAREAKDPDIRSYALLSLAYSRDRIHLPLFQEALRSQNSADRFAAIQALQIWNYPDSATNLIMTSKMDSSAALRVYAAQALLRMGNEMGRDVLLTMLNDRDTIAQAMAMRYLGEFGRAEDYGKLLAFLGAQQEPIVQAEMCSALLRLYSKKFEEENP
jgi:HEAT repeat protein